MQPTFTVIVPIEDGFFMEQVTGSSAAEAIATWAREFPADLVPSLGFPNKRSLVGGLKRNPPLTSRDNPGVWSSNLRTGKRYIPVVVVRTQTSSRAPSKRRGKRL